MLNELDKPNVHADVLPVHRFQHLELRALDVDGDEVDDRRRAEAGAPEHGAEGAAGHVVVPDAALLGELQGLDDLAVGLRRRHDRHRVDASPGASCP